MNENDYFTDRNYESNNRFNLDNFNNDDFNPRNYTQNYFHNNNQNDINEEINHLYYPNNNLNKKNFFKVNSNANQHNNDIVLFKKRINNLQDKLGKLNKFSSEINKAISYKFDNKNNNNNDIFNESLNKTQNYYENYNNNYLNENNKNLKINKSYDEFKINFNNYDFMFDPGNEENYEEDGDNLDNNFEEQEDELLDNNNINNNMNNQNKNLDLKDNEQFRDNSFIGFYDNVFASKNFELLNEEMNNNMENDVPENISNNIINNINKKYDYKNMQLYEQNYQFNIPKVTKNNILDDDKNKNNIQIVSNGLSILTDENKKKLDKENNLNDIKDKNLLKNEINNIIQNQNKENIENNKKLINLEEKRKKELQNYDIIIAKAKELNNQFNLEQQGHELKEELSNNDKENLINKKDQNPELKNKEKEKENIQSNSDKNNIIKLDKKDNNEDIKVRKIIKKDKNVSFIEDKIYIKYEQEDYILKTNVFNNKEKINFVTHDLKKYIHRLKKKEYLEPSIINCPNINYNKINNDIINLMKKEKIVPNQNPKINNRINKSVKNPTKMKIQINKNDELKNVKKIDKNGTKSNNKNNNIKIIKNTKNNKNEKNIKNITQDNLKKEKIMKKNKTDKLLKPKKDEKNENKKKEIKNLDILNDPIFKEGQRAINNLKKFFEENNLDEENNEE